MTSTDLIFIRDVKIRVYKTFLLQRFAKGPNVSIPGAISFPMTVP